MVLFFEKALRAILPQMFLCVLRDSFYICSFQYLNDSRCMKQTLQNLVAEGKIKQAIDQLRSLTLNEVDLNRDVNHLAARFSKYEQEYHSDVSDPVLSGIESNKKHNNMKKKKSVHERLADALNDLTDYFERTAAFRAENAEYLDYLENKMKAEGGAGKPVDPQDIQNAYDGIKEIEAAGLADVVEGFDALKYKGEMYQQTKAFAEEGRLLKRRFVEAQLALSDRIIKGYQSALAEARETQAAEGDDAELRATIKSYQKEIEKMQLSKVQLELEWAATHPNKLN